MSAAGARSRAWFEQAGMLAVLALLAIACSMCIPNFASGANVEAVLLSVATVGLVSCTMLFCLASGNFDLSVGSTVACAGVLAAVVMRDTGSIALGVLAALAAGAVMGLVNGVVVARARINPLITTLATMQIVRGAAYLASGGKAVGIAQESFFALGSTRPLGMDEYVSHDEYHYILELGSTGKVLGGRYAF